MYEYPAGPCTVVASFTRGPETWVGSRVTWVPADPDDSDATFFLSIHGRCEERVFPVRDLVTQPDGTVTAVMGPMEGPATSLEIRPTIEGDAVTSITMGGLGGYPMPVPVIAYLHRSNTFVQPDLYAVVGDDEATVSTVLLSSEVGMWLRRRGRWVPLVDDDEIDGRTVHDIGAPGLACFDAATGPVRVRTVLDAHDTPTVGVGL